MSLDHDIRAARQRRFYLDLSPTNGQVIAHRHGFVAPPMESQRAEAKDTVSTWTKVHKTGASKVIEDTSGWMARFADQTNRLTLNELQVDAATYQSYAVATVAALVHEGHLQWADDSPIDTSPIDQMFHDETPLTEGELGTLADIEALLSSEVTDDE